MNVMRWGTGADFWGRAEAFRMTHEVVNCVPLGIANQLRLYPEHFKRQPYLATIEDDGQVLAAAVMTPPNHLLLAFTVSHAALNALAADVASFDPATAGVSGAAPYLQWFAEQWPSLTGVTFERIMPE